MSDTLIGQKIGKYKIVEQLGRGGMAEVYKGYQENLDRHVAIKLMHAFLVSEQDFLHRFKREARAMAALNHPNIVGIYDFDVYGENTYYLVMEYIKGPTLKDKLEELAFAGDPMPLEEAVRISQEVADALAYAHSRGMVHRDIKPANIMINESGRAILTDFGIVKLMGGQSVAFTATGALIGTPAYMSPEQALGQPGDERCDIYSLGVLLFQMVTGKLPFDADTPLAVVMKHVNEPTPMPISFNPDVPVGMQEIILKAMAKKPEERYQTAEEMARALRTVDLSVKEAAVPPVEDELALGTADGTSSPVTGTVPATTAVSLEDATDTATAPGAAAPPKKRSPWLFVGIGLLAVILLIGGVSVFGDFFGGGGEATATVPVVGEVSTATPSATPAADTPTVDVSPRDTPDIVASSVAAIAQTADARASDTPPPTNTPTETATPSPTVDATAVFLSNCTTGVELVEALPQNSRFNTVPVEATFTMVWTLQNSGTCPWPADLTWNYVEGAEFGYDGEPIPLENAVAAEEEITLSASFVAPNGTDAFESTWQLFDTEEEPFGPAITFELRTYIPATATPRATATPQATATSETTEEVNWHWQVVPGSCEDVGRDWRCQVEITPYGGGGGPYVVFIFEGTQPKEYRGTGTFYHFAMAERCRAYNVGAQGVVVRDDATGEQITAPMYIDPNEYYDCVEAPQ